MGFTLKDILHNKARYLLHIETDPGLGGMAFPMARVSGKCIRPSVNIMLNKFL